MGLFDSLGDALKGVLGQGGTAAMPALIAAALGKTNLGDLSGIVAQLQQGGLGEQVSSWLGNGSNLPVSADQLRSALGNQQVRQLASQMGLPVDEALNLLSAHLPNMVDQASPNGTLPPAN